MTKQPVLLLSSNDSVALSVVRCLGEAGGFDIHVLSTAPRSSLGHSRYVQSTAVLPPASDESGRIACVLEALKRHGDCTLFPVVSDEIRFLGKHRAPFARHAFVHPVPDISAMETATNKWGLARFLQQHALAAPETVAVHLPGPPVIPALQYPIIIKPASGGWGHAIHEFATPEAFLSFADQYAGPPCTFVAQEFIHGYDIDCSCLCVEGEIVACTIQRALKANAHRFQPATVIEFVQEPAVVNLVSEMMKALAWTGVAHIDLRYDAARDRFVIIEVNGRYWGSLLGSLAAGVNFPALACRTARGEVYERPGYQRVIYATGHEGFRHLFHEPWLAFRLQGAMRFALRDPFPAMAVLVQRGWTPTRLALSPAPASPPPPTQHRSFS